MLQWVLSSGLAFWGCIFCLLARLGTLRYVIVGECHFPRSGNFFLAW
jgi:hypothetical protein